MPKYYNEQKIINKLTPYSILLNERRVNFISLYYKAVNFKIDYSKFARYKHVWSKGDNLFRLSNRFYNTKDQWWVIALYNQKPTDHHFTYGEEMFIPVNPDDFINEVLKYVL
jgi:hypothetical protein